jgi:hypothetical protein
MNEIIQRLMDQTGLPEDKAMAAAETVMNFLKEKLPPSVSSQIETLMGGNTETTGVLSGMKTKMGEMFGRRE